MLCTFIGVCEKFIFQSKILKIDNFFFLKKGSNNTIGSEHVLNGIRYPLEVSYLLELVSLSTKSIRNKILFSTDAYCTCEYKVR